MNSTALTTLGREPLYVRPVGGNWQVATRKPIAHYATKEAALDCAARMSQGTPGHYVILVQNAYEEEPEACESDWRGLAFLMALILMVFAGWVVGSWIAYLTR